MGEDRPVLRRELRVQVQLDLDRVGLPGQSPSPHQALQVGVDGDPRHVERVAEHDIRGLAAEAGQGDQLRHGPWQLPVEPLQERLAQVDQGAGLVPVEARRLDQLLQLRPGCGRVVGGGSEAGEDGRGGQVDPDVRALCGQDGGHGQFQRRAEVEFAVRVRIPVGQLCDNLAGPPGPGQRRRRGLDLPGPLRRLLFRNSLFWSRLFPDRCPDCADAGCHPARLP